MEGLRAGRKAPGADGRDRLGQDLHHGQRDPGGAAAHAGHVAQQDAGRPALRRVQGVLSAQRRPLLRQLLRLLPARGLHPAARHLHRERRLDQPGDRPAAAGGHQRAGEPPRRDHRGQRLVHLRPGLAGGLSGDDGRPGAWARSSTATTCLRKLVDIQYERNDIEFEPGKFRVRGDCVEVWPTYEEFAFRDRVLGRRGRAALDHQSHQRRGARAARSGCSSTRPSTSCCPRSGSTGAVDEIKQGAGRAAGAVQAAGEAAGGPAAQRPHAVRHRDAPGGGLLPGHRELQPAALGPAAGQPARHAVQLLSRRFPAVRRRIARHRAAGPRHVRRRPQPQGDAGGARLPPAQRAGQPAAAVRRVGEADQPGDLRLGHARAVRAGEDRRRGGRAGDPAHRAAWTRRSRWPRPAARCRTCWSRFASGRPRASGCWSPRSPSGWPRTWPPTSASRTCAASGSTASWTPSSAWSCSATCAKGISTCWWA